MNKSDIAGYLAVMISASIVIGIEIILLCLYEIFIHTFNPLSFLILLIVYWFILFLTLYSLLKLRLMNFGISTEGRNNE